MYLFVPPGLLTTIFEGYCHLNFKSSYWKNDGDRHTLVFNWENATYNLFMDVQTKTCVLNITVDNVPKFTFKGI